jgi:hypothetical protein
VGGLSEALFIVKPETVVPGIVPDSGGFGGGLSDVDRGDHG